MNKFLGFLKALVIGWLGIYLVFAIGSGFIRWDVEALHISEWYAAWRLLCFAAMLYWLAVGVKEDYL